METDGAPITGNRWYVVVFYALIFLGLVAVSFFFYRGETARTEKERYAALKTVAELKTNQIVEWRAQRIADISAASRNPFEVLTKWLHRDTPALRQELRERFELERRYRACSDVLLLSPKGRILFSLDADPAVLDKADKPAVKESLRRRVAVLSEPYRSKNGKVSIDAVAPVLDRNGTILGLLLYRMDANVLFHPLIESWSERSKNLEILLVRREGNKVLFLNELRQGRQSALSLRSPLDRSDLPAARAVLGGKGMFRGKDYRNVEVIADLRPIPQSGWYMVAKIDATDILQEARRRAWFVAFTVFLFLLLCAFLAAYSYRRRQSKLYRTLYRAEREQRESQGMFRTTFYSIGDAAITTDRHGLVMLMNPVAEETTGWHEKEARGKAVEQIFHVINEETRAEVENPVSLVLRSGAVVGLANHSMLIRKDGTEVAIDDSGAPIKDNEGAVVGVVLVFRDVSERRRAEEELQKSRAKLEAALASMTDAVAISDIDGKIVNLNDAFAAFHRFRTKEECRTTLGEYPAIVDVFLPDGRPAPVETWSVSRALRGETAVKAEYGLRRKDTGECWVGSYSFAPIHDKEGAIVGSVVVARDITEQKKAETALLHSEAKFRSYIEQSPLAVFVADRENRIVETNRSAARLLGYEQEELLKLRIEDLHPEEDREDVFRTFSELTRHGRIEGGYRFRKKDGSLIWVSIHAAMMSDELSLAYCSDITERKQIEKTLKRYELLSKNSRDIMIFFSEEARILEANAAAERVYGYTREELLRLTGRDLSADGEVRATADEIQSAGPEGMLYETLHRRKDGSTFPAEVSVRSATVGGMRTIVSVIRDIAERKSLEAQLFQAQKMEAVGTLAGGVAHDFNNILTVIMGLGNLMQMAVRPGDQLRPLADQIVASSEKAADLTRSLLAFSRKQQIDAAPLRVADLVAGAAKLLKRLVPEDVELGIDLADEGAVALMDAAQIDQVLMNLAANARDAMPRGGRLTISTGRARIGEIFRKTHGFGAPAHTYSYP